MTSKPSCLILSNLKALFQVTLTSIINTINVHIEVAHKDCKIAPLNSINPQIS